MAHYTLGKKFVPEVIYVGKIVQMTSVKLSQIFKNYLCKLGNILIFCRILFVQIEKCFKNLEM